MNNNQESERAGLCSTCIHSGYCTAIRYFKGKIIQCEQFNDKIFEMPINKMKDDQAQQANYHQQKGLCVNCDIVFTCASLKPDTGIWFCKDYH